MRSGADDQRPLVGREDQQRALEGLITGARNGVSGSVLIRGEPGIGKTALLQDVASRASGVQLVQLVGFEAESSIPFSGLQRLAAPLVRHLDGLPERHQQALLVATGAAEGPPPDRFLVGLGLLGLLAEAGERTPVVCAVDDAHWLDSESLDVLAFVARRLQAESVAVLFAMRDDPRLDASVAGVPTVRLSGLDPAAAAALLTTALPESIDPLAAAHIARSTGGNPLALIDLASELSIKQLTESSLADEPIRVGHHLEAHYVRRVRQLAPEVQEWLLVAAADSTGNVDLIMRAARHLGLADQAGDEAEHAGLIELGQAATFRHPLVRAAVYNSASGTDRRRAHDALSHAAVELDLVELEVWHAAKARVGTDLAVADRLEQVADLAGRRGGFASRVSVLRRSAELTPPGALRDGRLISAAEAALAAGAGQAAKDFLDDVDEDALGHLQRGRLISVRAALSMFMADPAALMRATADMLIAADSFHDSGNLALEQNALIKAFEYCLPPERLFRDVTLEQLGRRLQKGADLLDGVAAGILRALAAHVLLPYAEAVPIMRRAVDIVAGLEPGDLLKYGTISVALTTALWDEAARRDCLLRTAEVARDAGSLQLLDSTLWIMSLAELTGGVPRRAEQYMEQVRELRRAMGYEAEHVVNVALLAWTRAPRSQVRAIAEGAQEMGFGGVHSSAIAALAVRDLAGGHYRDAYVGLKPLIDDPFLQVTPTRYPDFVEAAVRSGHGEEAADFVQRLELMADANGSPWTRGAAERSRALLTVDGSAERHYTAAITRLASADVEVDLARAHLLYGEWLRRLKRRREAREQLRTAREMFERTGAVLFAERARSELEATGAHASPDGPRQAVDLTSQEAMVARLAGSGSTNAEIGATLFISVNTVDYHLRKVFQKLGITSRRQLADRLDG